VKKGKKSEMYLQVTECCRVAKIFFPLEVLNHWSSRFGKKKSSFFKLHMPDQYLSMHSIPDGLKYKIKYLVCHHFNLTIVFFSSIRIEKIVWRFSNQFNWDQVVRGKFSRLHQNVVKLTVSSFSFECYENFQYLLL